MAGNANSGRHKGEQKFRDALNHVLMDSKDGPNARLRRLVDRMVKEAEKGEAWAIKEVADRLDGKPAQAIVGDEDNPLTMIHKIEREIVRPNSKD